MKMLVLISLVGCVGLDFDPPDEPDHNDYQGGELEPEASGANPWQGAYHARLYEEPFLCLDAQTGVAVTCPTDGRPDDKNLSCDAAGCHGDYDYSPDYDPAARQLHGSDGPSCYSCHGEEWKDD